MAPHGLPDGQGRRQAGNQAVLFKIRSVILHSIEELLGGLSRVVALIDRCLTVQLSCVR